MIRTLSLPMIVTAGVSFFFGVFFLLLYFRLKLRHADAVRHYFLFSSVALISGVFLGAFSVVMNSASSLDRLDVANRIAIITVMFNILLTLQFYVSFFEYRPPVSLKWLYFINVAFSLICLVPNRYFLAKEFYRTSSYYTGLTFGPLFRVWGFWIVAMSLYGILVLYRIYVRVLRDSGQQYKEPLQALIAATTIWLIAGISDDLTAVQVIDLPPATWVGSILITGSIAWILIAQIDTLYEDRRRLTDDLIRDHLTDVFSRSFFNVRLAEAVAALRAGRLGGLHVCMFDVDDFKSVNDRFGHSAGDRVLKEIAAVARGSLRESDCVARFGGDEFAILLPDVTKERTAAKIVERIRVAVTERRFQFDKSEVTVTCSFGLVRCGPEHARVADLADQLLACADSTLYGSKRQGKNAVTVLTLPPTDPATGSRWRIGSSLRPRKMSGTSPAVRNFKV